MAAFSTVLVPLVGNFLGVPLLSLSTRPVVPGPVTGLEAMVDAPLLVKVVAPLSAKVCAPLLEGRLSSRGDGLLALSLDLAFSLSRYLTVFAYSSSRDRGRFLVTQE